MKRTILDIFKREFNVRLTVGGRDTVPGSADQLHGISVGSPNGDAVFRIDSPAAVETTRAMIRALHPGILRVYADSADFSFWMDFCQKEEIFPHIVLTPEHNIDAVRAKTAACGDRFKENDLWTPCRFYEITCDFDSFSFASDELLENRIDSMRELAEGIRSIDPDGTVILSGIAPFGENQGRAELWNPLLLRKCGDVMDMLGISLTPTVLSGRTWNESDEGIEVDHALAEEVRKAIQRLDRQIAAFDPESPVRIAVTGWSFLTDGVPQKRQDCIYYSSVFHTLRMASAAVSLCECGPLFGAHGLLDLQDDTVFGNVFYHDLLVAESEQPVVLGVHDIEIDKTAPDYHWEGIPGICDGGDIQMLDAHASRSRDGKQLFLLLTNRSPFKRAVPRVHFSDLPEMHPVKACVLRSKKRLDENSAQTPENVWCKEVKLRKYRNMDHVNLDIPECSTICMLLESD